MQLKGWWASSYPNLRPLSATTGHERLMNYQSRSVNALSLPANGNPRRDFLMLDANDCLAKVISSVS